MPLPAFQRLTERVLAHMGEPARLRGEVMDPPLLANVEHGVELAGLYGEVTAARSVATIESKHNPKVKDTLDMLDASGNVVQSYVLDVLYNDNGYSRRFVLREV